MSAPRIHRTPAGCKAARQLQAQTQKPITGAGPTREQQEWNAAVDAKRQARKGWKGVKLK